MAEIDYTPVDHVLPGWTLRVSGYNEEVDGEHYDGLNRLSGVEYLMEDLIDEYVEQTHARLTRVRGEHGWREFTWDDGAVHRYDWEMYLIDLRCQKCKGRSDLYMLEDEVWEATGLDGWVCFRCVEAALGRRLTPADFKGEGIPANTDQTTHEPELRERIGLPADEG
ncbi:hypothetical protein GOARA_029_00010 [Gordonia araii NBRC 100433]|uniref:Uncharacterized protein n=1 Tax=Gordonia araii NBRC 100433 TaxID=1073574 RepID=G7GZW2_9ACTN|nr:hypothetical protein [Gordonia araii]NNG99187.1 hypothetical protein [Gordonia araii NBRC 100433]GAB09137.1 hypothetical protein GOARA_029_00010 [Gordonia araii NBRC 100433]